MKYSRLLVAVVVQVLRPRRRNLAASALLVAFIPFVVFVVNQLMSSPPLFADVDIHVVIIEEHHEGK